MLIRACTVVTAFVGVLLGAVCAPAAVTGVSSAHVNLIVLDTTINPAVVDFIHESISSSVQDGAAALIIQLDTPGGLLNSTKTIVKDLLSAPLPIIVYVAPSGAGAGSAGVFITMAGHIAAMAPGTTRPRWSRR